SGAARNLQRDLRGNALLVQGYLPVGEALVVLLPLGGLRDARDLHRGHLVFRAVGRPIGVVRGDHVRARFREVEGGVDDARLHARRDGRAQHRAAGAADDAAPVAFLDAALLRVVRVDLAAVFAVPHRVGGAARLRADVVLRQDAAGGEDQRV